MGVRTEWSRVDYEAPEVVGEYQDAYGSRLDEGGVALVLGVDSVYLIEAASVDDIRELAQGIIDACDAYEHRAGEGK